MVLSVKAARTSRRAVAPTAMSVDTAVRAVHEAICHGLETARVTASAIVHNVVLLPLRPGSATAACSPS